MSKVSSDPTYLPLICHLFQPHLLLPHLLPLITYSIHAEEIFGALAVFTRQSRIASVVATSDCTVLAVRKEDFVDLIEHQPYLCLGLIEEMAEKINALNAQILALNTKNS